MRNIPAIELDLNKPETFGNVAAKLNDDDRRTLATDIIELIGVDENSMGPWLGKARGYLNAIEDENKGNPQNTEQQGANEQPPPSTEMTLSSVIQFSARASGAILGEPDLIKASETGGEDLAKWVSSQLRAKDKNWVLDTDPLVVHMAVTGLAWRKRDFDDDEKVFHSHFLPCTDVKINANVRSVERAPRITHEFERYPYEIERSIQRKKWLDYEPNFDDRDPQEPHKFYETDLWLDLDGDGLAEPWTVVIAREDNAQVVRIRPRWSKKTVVDTDDALFFNPIHRFYPYRFLPDPKGGFFPMGFGRILDRTQSTADQLLSAIVDTAKTESQNGGIMAGGGVGLPAAIEVQNNRIETLNTDGAPLTNRFQMFPVKSVSQGSVATLEKVMTLGDRLAGTLNLLENAPASMSATMAKGIIDTGSQIQSAVHRRMCQSLTQESQSFVNMADAYDQLPEGITKADGDSIAVTADPQLATEMQRSALAGVYMEMLKQAIEGVPWKMEILQARLCEVLRIPNGKELIGERQQPQLDPKDKANAVLGLMKQRTENMKVIGAVAQQLTQAMKNMVEAAGGMQNNQAALLTMAQLEESVRQLMQENANAGNDINGMAPQPGNQGAGQLPPPAAGGGDSAVSVGVPGGSGDAGQGGGLP